MPSLHPLALRFRDTQLQRDFTAAALPRTLHQSRMAMLVGMVLYMAFGLLDRWFVPADEQAAVWVIRCIALTVPLTVLCLSFSRHFARQFARHCHLLLALVGLAAGLGLIAALYRLPPASMAHYYPGIVLVTFYTYNFIGTRFIHALAVDLFLLLSYNLTFGLWLDYPTPILASHNFIIISANLIGGTAGYLAERQRCLLYLRERELDAERQHHLQRSLHDALTGLPNHELLADRIAQAETLSQRDGGRHCALFVDLDGFKGINDRYGHRIGDQVLCEIARRLQHCVRESDTVARIGGDEFFVLALGVGDEAAAARLAEKLLDQFRTPLTALPSGADLGASIGICLFPEATITTAAPLIERADAAMYQAKAAGKFRYCFAA